MIGCREESELMGRGLGWVDVHLLVAAKENGLKLWTLDKKLAAVAEAMNVAAVPARAS